MESSNLYGIEPAYKDNLELETTILFIFGVLSTCMCQFDCTLEKDSKARIPQGSFYSN